MASAKNIMAITKPNQKKVNKNLISMRHPTEKSIRFHPPNRHNKPTKTIFPFNLLW